MKKLLALVLALMLALLTSCEMFVPAPPESQRPDFGLPSLPAGTEDPIPTQTADPAEENYGFTVFPEGNYLADKKFDTDEFLPDYDADPSFIQFLSTRPHSLCQTTDTVYSYIGDGSHGGFILFTDKATSITLPLCGKPECLHSDSTCNAYVSRYADGLRVYDGKLYWVDGERQIIRMNPDGTDRETVAAITDAYDGISNDPTYFIHRGYAYFIGSRHGVVLGGKVKTSFRINVRSLDSSEAFTVLDKLLDGDGGECMVKPVGNDLYIMLYCLDYVDMEASDETFTKIELYRWDSETRQVEFLYSARGVSGEWGFNRTSFYPVPGDGIYMQGYRILNEEGEDGPVRSVWQSILKYSFESGELEEAWGYMGETIPHYTKDHIIVNNVIERDDESMEHTIYVYNYEGDLFFIRGLGEDRASCLMGVDDEFIYYYCYHGSPPDVTHHYFAVPLDGGEIIVIE